MKNTVSLFLVLILLYASANEQYTVAQWFEDMTFVLEKETNCSSSGITCYSDENETKVTTNIDEVQRIKVYAVFSSILICSFLCIIFFLCIP